MSCRIRALLAIALVLLLGSGCSSASTYLPMTIAVRDAATQAPIAGARVDARTVHFFLPAGSYSILDGSPPSSARGVTADDGTVTLEVIVDHPVQVTVVVAGYALQVLDVRHHPAVTNAPSEWLDADPRELNSGPPRIEVQFRP